MCHSAQVFRPIRVFYELRCLSESSVTMLLFTTKSSSKSEVEGVSD